MASIMASFGVGGSGAYGCSGLQNYKDQALPELKFNGSVTLENTSIAGDTSGNGLLNMVNSSLNTINLKGTVSCTGSVVEGISSIMGMINATKTQFKGQLNLNTNHSTFVDCSTKDIMVEDSSGRREQRITLKGETHIRGNISFYRGDGVVIKGSGCTIEGEVVGGIVVVEE